MKQQIATLIIDDHPVIIEAYESALVFLEKSSDFFFNIDSSLNSDDALDKVKFSKFDLIFLDIKMPPNKSRDIVSGEDLGLRIKESLPDVKIIVSTMFNDNFRINNILKTLDPDGLLIKDDIKKDIITQSVISVLNNEPYYSKTVLSLLKKIIKNDFVLDNIDRLLLFHLSKGVKTKDLNKYIPLSKAGIERRKRQLKIMFEKENCDDSDLLRIAEQKGFI